MLWRLSENYAGQQLPFLKDGGYKWVKNRERREQYSAMNRLSENYAGQQLPFLKDGGYKWVKKRERREQSEPGSERDSFLKKKLNAFQAECIPGKEAECIPGGERDAFIKKKLIASHTHHSKCIENLLFQEHKNNTTLRPPLFLFCQTIKFHESVPISQFKDSFSSSQGLLSKHEAHPKGRRKLLLIS